MDIKAALLEDKVQRKASALKVAEYAVSSQKNFKELMRCFMDNEYRLSQRAAWSVSWAGRKKPELIKPYVKDLVAQLEKNDVHDAVRRNSVRVLEATDIPKSLHGKVIDVCFKLVEKPTTPAAIKAFFLTTLFNLSKFYPGIQQELKLIIEERYKYETAAFKSRSKKILRQLEKNKV